jgi:hypothetical protein
MHEVANRLCFASLLAASVGLGAACRLADQAIPSLAGPSSLALAVSVAASPDTLLPDGVSQSRITIGVRDAANRPVVNLVATVDLEVGDFDVDPGRLSARIVSTDVNGQATTVYTVPRARRGTRERIVTIKVVVVGTSFGETLPRFVRIRLRAV